MAANKSKAPKKPISRAILTPCPPRKGCIICEARLEERFGSSDPTRKARKYLHQAVELGVDATNLLHQGKTDASIKLYVKAASYANLYLNTPQDHAWPEED